MRALLERSAPSPIAPPPAAFSEDLPFAVERTADGELHVRTWTLGAEHRTGHAPAMLARHADPRLLSLLALDRAIAEVSLDGALFVDTETTALAGGTGTVPFLVGLAWFHGHTLVVEQLLVRRLGEEAPVLARVRERIERASLLVSFNGKSFDLPLLRTRFVMNRIEPPPARPHLDLLHVARRVHKARRMACRLVSLERDVLGFVRENDVPSGEVSSVYLHFLRTGDGEALRGVVDHNAWDVVTMASLLGLYGEPLSRTRLVAEDLAGLAGALHQGGDAEAAMEAATLAVDRGLGVVALRARARVAKARGDRDRALLDWEAIERAGGTDEDRLELAKLYEHHVRDPGLALAVAARGTSEDEPAREKRRRRLEKKRERHAQAALFPRKTSA
jgi:uncharacterized protein YprB with RNaseH-like and TPR domain